MCSSCLRFMRDPPVDLPALSGRKDPAERAALAEAPPLLPRIEQVWADRLPLQPQDATPFLHRRRRSLLIPPPARGPSPLEIDPGRIPVDDIGDGLRQREAPSIYLFMGLHSIESSIRESGDQHPFGSQRSESQSLRGLSHRSHWSERKFLDALRIAGGCDIWGHNGKNCELRIARLRDVEPGTLNVERAVAGRQEGSRIGLDALHPYWVLSHPSWVHG
jgi:hypothetical protein